MLHAKKTSYIIELFIKKVINSFGEIIFFWQEELSKSSDKADVGDVCLFSEKFAKELEVRIKKHKDERRR